MAKTPRRQWECTVCGERIVFSRLLSCKGGCGALYFCSEEHAELCARKLGHDEEECSRMRRQREEAERLGAGDPEGEWPWAEACAETRGLGVLEAMGSSETGALGCEATCRDCGDGFLIASSVRFPLSPSGRENAQGAPTPGWRSYYREAGLPPSSPAALFLHAPLTLAHALRELGWLPPESGPVRVHLAGAAHDECSLLACLAELAYCSPLEGRRLEVACVGPSVPALLDGLSFAVGRRRDELGVSYAAIECQGEIDGSSVTCLRADAYNADAARRLGGHPHAIFAQNAGIAAYSAWAESAGFIRELCEEGAAFVATDYCEEAALRGAAALSSRDGEGGRGVAGPKPSPFRRPIRMASEDNDLPSWSNGFWFGLGPGGRR